MKERKDKLMGKIKSKKSKLGNVYEIKLPNEDYVYLCLIEKFSFGFFDYKSKKKNESIENLSELGFKMYKTGKETAINNKKWELIGKIDLEKENIQWPDLANYALWDVEGSIERLNITREGSLIKVSKEYYLSLVERGLIDGFFDKPENLESWIMEFFDNYPKRLGW